MVRAEAGGLGPYEPPRASAPEALHLHHQAPYHSIGYRLLISIFPITKPYHSIGYRPDNQALPFYRLPPQLLHVRAGRPSARTNKRPTIRLGYRALCTHQQAPYHSARLPGGRLARNLNAYYVGAGECPTICPTCNS